MAAKQSADHGAPMDYPAHDESYARFLWILKVGSIATAVVVAAVVLIIAS